ncbi:MAG: DoxX family membrane protein [Ignavibacteriae bacterium]|nr:DoxX family membrane protein [Ignavibacteriota bacterium]
MTLQTLQTLPNPRTLQTLILENEYIALALRLLLGFVFVVASIEKIADPNAFAVSIGNYKLVGSGVAVSVATVLPWIELLAGLFLIFGVMMRGSSLLIFLMLIVFTAGVFSAMLRGLDISCGCFSRDPAVGRVGWLKVVENTGLILSSIALFFSRANRFSIAHVISSTKDTHVNDHPVS